MLSRNHGRAESPTVEGTSIKDRRPKKTGRPGKSTEPDVEVSRRATLSRLGRFAAVTPPAVVLVLAAITKPAGADTAS